MRTKLPSCMFKAIIKSAEEVDLICGIDPEVVEARLILYYGSQEALDEAVAKSMQKDKRR